MKQPYTSPERNVQIIIEVLKAHGIRRVIASPGSTNIAVVGSMQNDPFFEMYSCVDERSAAYMACGMAAASGEPVVLSCTGATASRNYYPALTEAYYRKLPVLALTSSQDSRKFGHLKDQITDRSNHPTDLVCMSVCLQNVRDDDDEWDVTIKSNQAVLELNHHGGGPVHINIETTHNRTFMYKDISPVRIIRRYSNKDMLPELPVGRVAIFVGSHLPFTKQLIEAVERFCRVHDAVVMGEPNCGYHGSYKIADGLIGHQQGGLEFLKTDTLIHIGEIANYDIALDCATRVWRVSEDGQLRDRAHRLTDVFEMSELDFFTHYAIGAEQKASYLESCKVFEHELMRKMPDLPLSNLWVASQLYNRLPKGSFLCLGILAPLRSWNFFPLSDEVVIDCNQGGFGIDGNMSTLIGASLIDKNRLHYAIVGDLSFFYDMNCLGNRHISNNIRILLVNNGDGCEFQLDSQMGKTLTRDETDMYMSAGGHYGCQSRSLVKNYVESLGFEYMSATTKEEFLEQEAQFICAELSNRPMVLEVFTHVDDENDALNAMMLINGRLVSPQLTAKKMTIKNVVKQVAQKVAKKILD